MASSPLADLLRHLLSSLDFDEDEARLVLELAHDDGDVVSGAVLVALEQTHAGLRLMDREWRAGAYFASDLGKATAMFAAMAATAYADKHRWTYQLLSSAVPERLLYDSASGLGRFPHYARENFLIAAQRPWVAGGGSRPARSGYGPKPYVWYGFLPFRLQLAHFWYNMFRWKHGVGFDFDLDVPSLRAALAEV